MSGKLSYEQVRRFNEAKMPLEVEDEVLGCYARFSLDGDMVCGDLVPYFEELELPRGFYKHVRKEQVAIEGTDIVDFDLLLKVTYHILIFMDNESLIDQLWGLLLQASGRLENDKVKDIKDHILSIKDLQKVENYLGDSDPRDLINMVSVATGGKRVYMTYLDFAYVLGKLGYLKY
ncbi:DNA repair protein RAD33 [Nakaseomyces bracarensis]|uniref:DNA repair protein RAD33 n=1 Tax=Nakaseomyces bracarensis TaxID=273131 RepID=A0ABR4NX35_9SACH